VASYHLGQPVGVKGVVHHRAVAIPGIGSVAVGFSWQKVVLDAALAALVWRLLLQHRFDVVHCVEESIFFALPLARARGARVIFDLNSSVAHQLEYSRAVRSRFLLHVARVLQTQALRRSALAITVGRALTEEGVRSLVGEMPVAEIEDCAVDEGIPARPDEVVALRLSYGLSDRPVAVYTGNLAGYQGLELLYSAFATVLARCPEARLLVVGGNPEAVAASRDRSDVRALGGAVIFAGTQPTARMPAFMALASALVSPRTGGGNTPLKLYSYMASGVPIVATLLPTHTQVLDRTCAVLCDPTPQSFGERLADVIENPSAFSSLGEAARLRARERYSSEAFSLRLIDAYESILPRAFRSSATTMYPGVQGTSESSAANARMAG
jgi:glycosyltransferase involved in cell wall biosynthesis